MTTANFSQIQNWGSSASLMGYEFARTAATTFTLSQGSARAFGSDFMIEYPGNLVGLPSSLTVTVTTTGINGCYPNAIGTPSETTVYPVIMLGDSSGKNTPGAVIYTGSDWTTGNFLVSGYDSFRIVNIVIINTSAQVVPLLQKGSYEDRFYQLADAIIVLNAGAATTATGVDLTASGGVVVPGWCKTVQILYAYTPNSAANILKVTPTGLTSTTYPVQVKASGAAAVNGTFLIAPGINSSSNASIDYLGATSDATSLYVSGFEMSFKLAMFNPV